MSVAEAGGMRAHRRAFADTSKRAALMPYVMGGFPTLAESLRIGEACVQAGADVIELGDALLGPARRWTRDPRRRHARARGGCERGGCA